jgi:hypothetical protein
MEYIRARNVNDAYVRGLSLLSKQGSRQSSRAGEVVVVPFPVVTAYSRPRERVLFAVKRDANPFFHLFEALWMLTGSNDATWLDRFVSDFSSRFAEVGGVQHGAYGHRWREAFGYDQLGVIAHKLNQNRSDRQAVLQMWDASMPADCRGGECDPEQRGGFRDLTGEWKDRPCNTHAYFAARGDQLHITVCCRSNDAIWGAYGANAVHFSVLQEYMAAMTGLQVGTYYQLSNNFHAYTNIFEHCLEDVIDPYIGEDVLPMSLVHNPADFDEELAALFSHGLDHADTQPEYNNKFLSEVVWPMYRVHRAYKENNVGLAGELLQLMPKNNDWQVAATLWLSRRMSKRKAKEQQ